MREEHIIIAESPQRKELLEGEIPTAKQKLETNYKMLRELHKAQIRATDKVMALAEKRLAEINRLVSLLDQTEKALAIKNTVMEQMVAIHAQEKKDLQDELQGLKHKRRR